MTNLDRLIDLRNGANGRSISYELDPREVFKGGVMCAEGMVCIAIFAMAMVFTRPSALRQQKLHMWLVRRGSLKKDIRCAPAIRGGTGIQCGSAVVTCTTAKSWKKELSHRQDFIQQSLLDDPGQTDNVG